MPTDLSGADCLARWGRFVITLSGGNSIGKLEFSKLSFRNWRARTHRRLLFCLILSIALANSLNDWRLTSVNI